MDYFKIVEEKFLDFCPSSVPSADLRDWNLAVKLCLKYFFQNQENSKIAIESTVWNCIKILWCSMHVRMYFNMMDWCFGISFSLLYRHNIENTKSAYNIRKINTDVLILHFENSSINICMLRHLLFNRSIQQIKELHVFSFDEYWVKKM